MVSRNKGNAVSLPKDYRFKVLHLEEPLPGSSAPSCIAVVDFIRTDLPPAHPGVFDLSASENIRSLFDLLHKDMVVTWGSSPRNEIESFFADAGGHAPDVNWIDCIDVLQGIYPHPVRFNEDSPPRFKDALRVAYDFPTEVESEAMAIAYRFVSALNISNTTPQDWVGVDPKRGSSGS